jgi:hypothetical protein
MHMKMRDARAAIPAEVVSDIESIRFKFVLNDSQAVAEKAVQDKSLLVGNLMYILNMTGRKNHYMAGIKRVEVDGNDKIVPARNFEINDLRLIIPECTEDTIHQRLITFDVLQFVRIEKISSHYFRLSSLRLAYMIMA